MHICTADKAVELAKQMLGATLVTKQTGAQGAPTRSPASLPLPRRPLCPRALAAAWLPWHALPAPPPRAGKPVNTLYVARKMKLAREMYFALLLDRKTSGPIMIGCRCVARAASQEGSS